MANVTPPQFSNQISFSSPFARYRQAARCLLSPGRPSFLIIGAQKAGTTALHDILQGHSRIDSGRRKELRFFNNDHWYANRFRRPYFMLFPPRNRRNRDHLFFEATPGYIYHPEALSRIKAYNPEMKLIVLLREPASRARSAWIMSRHYSDPLHPSYYEKRSFAQCIEEGISLGAEANGINDKPGYIGRGLYAQQLKRVFAHFPRQQVLILENRQLRNEHDKTISTILNFFGLPQEYLPLRKGFPSVINAKNLYPEEMSLLKEYFKPHNEELFELLGHDYGWNNTP